MVEGFKRIMNMLNIMMEEMDMTAKNSYILIFDLASKFPLPHNYQFDSSKYITYINLLLIRFNYFNVGEKSSSVFHDRENLIGRELNTYDNPKKLLDERGLRCGLAKI